MTTQKKIIQVENTPVSVIRHQKEDYISITDMLKAKDGDFFTSDWLRNRNTIEFLGIWESLNNPDFNYGEFAIIKNQAGLNNYKLSVKDWMEKTRAIGLIARTGRYGGTYAHKDIAFEFGLWISPQFKLYLIKEFQRLKDDESKDREIDWDFRRVLATTNNAIHTDAIKENLLNVPAEKEFIIYAAEADLINLAIFGHTAKQWKELHPKETKAGKKIRDSANTNQLIVLSNMEALNAHLIRQGKGKEERFAALRAEVAKQLVSLGKATTAIPKPRIRSLPGASHEPPSRL